MFLTCSQLLLEYSQSIFSKLITEQIYMSRQSKIYSHCISKRASTSLGPLALDPWTLHGTRSSVDRTWSYPNRILCLPAHFAPSFEWKRSALALVRAAKMSYWNPGSVVLFWLHHTTAVVVLQQLSALRVCPNLNTHDTHGLHKLCFQFNFF